MAVNNTKLWAAFAEARSIASETDGVGPLGFPYMDIVESEWAENNRRVAEYGSSLRYEAMRVLSGKCARCGFSDSRALQIDHIHGRKLAREHWRSELKVIITDPDYAKQLFQILCANCNWIKRYDNHEASGRRRC